MAAIASVVVFVILALSAGMLHVPVVRQFVLQKGEQYLAENQKMDVQAERLDYNLFGLKSTLQNVTIRTTDPPDAPVFFHADKVFVDLNMSALLRGKLEVEEARIEGGRISWIIDEAGVSNMPKPPPAKEPAPESNPNAPLPLLVQLFEAAGPSIHYENRQSGDSVDLPQWTMSIHGDRLPQKHAVDFAIGRPGSVVYEGRSAPLEQLQAGLDLLAGELRVRRFQARSGEASVSVTGAIRDFADPVADLTAVVSGEIAPLIELANLDTPASGRLELSAKITDKLSAPHVDATISATNLAYQDLREMTLQAEAAWAAGDDRARIASFSLQAPFGQVAGDADLALSETAGESRTNLQLTRVDLGRLSRPFDLPMRPAARATGSVQASWPGLDFQAADAKGQLRLAATRSAPAKGVLPLSGSVNLTKTRDRLTAALTNVDTLGVRAGGNVVLRDLSGLDGALQIQIAELGDTVAAADLLLDSPPGESVAPTALAGPLSASIGLGGTMDAPRLAIQANSDSLKAGEIENVAFRFDGAYAPTEAVIDALELTWKQQSLSVAGRVGLEGDSPALDLHVNAPRIVLADALAAFERDEPVTGELSLTADVTGTVERPTGRVDAQATDLIAYNEPLGSMQLRGSLDQGVALIEELLLQKPDGGTLRASGSYGLEDGRYTVQAEGSGLTLEKLTLPSGESVRGRVDLSANGEGTVEAPQLTAKLGAHELFVGETEVGEVEANADVADGRAKLQVSAPRFKSVLEADSALAAPHQSSLRLAVDAFDLATLNIQGRDDKPVQGLIDGVITAQGPLDQPESFTVEADLNQLKASTGGVEVRNEGPLRASYRNRNIFVDHAELISGRSKLSLDGSLPLTASDGQGALTVAGAINLEAVPALLGLTLEEAFVLGILNINGTVGGSLESLRPQLDALLEDGVVFTPGTIKPVTNIQMHLTADQQRIELASLTADYGHGTVSANGGVPMALVVEKGLPVEVLAQKQPARFEAAIEGIDLEELEVIPDGGGFIGGKLQAEAPTLNPEDVTGSLELDRLELFVRDLSLQQAEPIRLSFSKGLLEIASFRISGPETQIEASGKADLFGSGALDVAVNGHADAGVVGYLVEDLRMSGPVVVDLRAEGTIKEPKLQGRFTLTDGNLALESPRFDADRLQIALNLEGERLEIETMQAALNGGTFSAKGGLSLADGIRDVDVSVSANEIFLDFPEGLRTLSTANLRFHDAPDNLLRLDGSVKVEDGSFRDRVDIGADILELLGSDGMSFAQEPDPLLARIRYGVEIDTVNPILVDNNLARMEANLDLRLVGSYYRPSLLGRAVLEEGGEVYLAENNYVIETGVIDFTNETRIRPSLNLRARTQVAGHDITMLVTGSADDLETQFTSDTGLSEPDIISLLLTGRTLEEAQESGLNIAREQALSYLTGSLGGRLGRAAEESLGLSRVRVEPNLISSEGDPSARLTIGQDITRRLNLIYSMNLTNSGDQIFVTEYDVTRRFNLRAVKQSDNTYRFDFKHDIRWGLENEEDRGRKSGPKIEIAALDFQGDPKLPEEELRKEVGLKVGDRYDFFKTRKKTDKLQAMYQDRDRLESRVRLRRQQDDAKQTVDLHFQIDAGPRIEFAFSPVEPPGGVRKKVRQAWSLGVFEAQRIDDAVDALQRWLYADGYLEPEIDHQVEIPEEDRRIVRFIVRPGVKYTDVKLVFEGNKGLTDEQLELALERTDLRKSLRADPRDVAETLTRYYYQEGWLTAKVERPEFDLEPDTGFGRVVIKVDEGKQFQIGELTFNGASAVTEEELRSAVTPEEGRVYTPQYLQEAIENVEAVYWAKGYNDVLVNFRLTRRVEDARVDIGFELTENQQDVVKEIAVEGNEQVSAKLIRKRLTTKEGDLLITENNDKSRRRLYDTGAFSLVDLQAQPLDQSLSPQGQNSLRLLAKVREVSPFRVRYGGFFDTDRGPGIITDFVNRNTLGSARVLGFRGRYDNDFREARGYFSQPLLMNFPVTTTSALFRSRELRQTFVTDRTGMSVQQEIQISRKMIFQYGYRFERTHTFDRDPDAFIPLDISFNLAPLTSTLTFDSRDNILDATHGQFFSHGFEYAPSTLGSDVRYIKYFGQYFRYMPFFRPKETPFDRKPKRPRLIYATGVRVGLANGLGGQDIVPSERFFAGGGTTIRGFQQDRVGPQDFFGDPTGGDSVFILNNEARFPLVSIFEGVGFVDVGNVYDKWSDFDPTSLRSTAGVGLRVRTPFFLLRMDYGMKLDRKEGESSGAFFFSIGQAF
ncbi:MAG: BamA/TamA family outer membrane protein [Acidobacteria bacterium]|nr:BamA/TamA family outer membrane protein [Acidobacteriota bacterium]